MASRKKKKSKNKASQRSKAAATPQTAPPTSSAPPSSTGNSGFLETVGRWSGMFAERFVPDPWIYAMILTAVAMIAAYNWGDPEKVESVNDVVRAWSKGLWNPKILVLIAQFSFNLIVCTALAQTKLVQKVLSTLAAVPKSARQAIALVAAVSIGLGLISWALCIVGGAIFGQEVCRQAKRRGIKVHYPLAISSGYLGMMTFGFGLTSSAPLMVAQENHFLASKIGVIPFNQTVGSPMSLATLALLLIACPTMLAFMHPSKKIHEVSLGAKKREIASPAPTTFAQHLEHSQIFLKVAAILPCWFLYNYYIIDKKGLSIDSMNLVFLCAALILFKRPKEMLEKLSEAARGVWSIVFQFPFYAGLMGIIIETGLGARVAEFFVSISNQTTWPALGVAFQGLCNLFVPSAGGQWLVTGNILIDASRDLAFSDRQAVMIEVMGDQLTNMVQPMWALPALALSGLKAKDILGYTAVVMVAAYFIMAIMLTMFPLS
ncbi:MAG: TIGR00366 family protein [Planctomycetota bacterium]|nr:TIGR00366 family protein [Planctomycetota bacterium]